MNKTDIAREYLEKYGDLPTKTIARIMAKEKPLLFTVEAARSRLRYLRGNHGQRNREMARRTDSDQHFRPNQAPKDYFKELPKPLNPYEKKWGAVPIKIKKALVLYDLHIPFHSNEALRIALDYGREIGCEDVIIPGDLIDCFSISRFARDITIVQFREELEMGRKMLEILRQAFPGNIYLKEGNHEERLGRYLSLRAPELLGIEEFRLKNVLKTDELGIEYIGDRRPLKMGHLNIIHGHEFLYSPYNPVNPARGYFLKTKAICIGGHLHQTSGHTEMTLEGKMITAWSAGCLCDLHPKYSPINKWNHGFVVIDNGEKKFMVHNFRIVDGEIV